MPPIKLLILDELIFKKNPFLFLLYELNLSILSAKIGLETLQRYVYLSLAKTGSGDDSETVYYYECDFGNAFLNYLLQRKILQFRLNPPKTIVPLAISTSIYPIIIIVV